MKSTLILFVMTLLSFSSVMAQDLSPKTTAKSGNIEVSYSQPSKRNRVIFGELVPYGEVWRTGANEATVIEFKKDMMFGGKSVKKGKYALFTIPREKEWTVILNSNTDQWGSYDYEKTKGKNIAEVVVPVYMVDAPQEKLMILPKADGLSIEWDKTGVLIPIK